VPCEKAHAIISASYNTKADLVGLFGTDPAKIFVIHHGIDQQCSHRARVVCHLPERFILYVGNRTRYKNFGQLIESMGRLSQRYADLHLVCAGGGPFDNRERDILQTQSLFQRVHQREFSDPELAYCYTKAAGCAFPSLYEGFGFPILESF
jgi:glycosyltransferase involved in cell wall biosynthesis